METRQPTTEVVVEDTLPTALLEEASRSEAALVLLPQKLGESGAPEFAGSTTSVQKLLTERGILCNLLPAQSPRYREDRSLDWVAPTLFVSLAMYSQNPETVSVALNVIGSYVYDLFRGREKDALVRLDILCFRGLGIHARRIKYRGPVEGLKSLSENVREALETSDD